MRNYFISIALIFAFVKSHGQATTFEITSATTAKVQILVQINPMFEPEVIVSQTVEKGKNTIPVFYEKDSYAYLRINGVSKTIFFEPAQAYGIEILPDGKFTFTKNGRLNTAMNDVAEIYGSYRYKNKLYYEWSTKEFPTGISELRNHILDSLSNRTQKLSNFEEQVLKDYVTFRFTSQILNFYWGKHRPGHPAIKEVTNPELYAAEIESVKMDDNLINRNLDNYQLSLKYYAYLKSDPVTSSMIDNGVTAMEPFLDSLYRLTDEVNYPSAVKSYLFADILQELIATSVPKNFTQYLNKYIADYPESPYYEDIMKKYNKILKLTTDEKAPEIIVQNIITQEKELLSTYTGKTIYLDFWATWCGPCIKELPAFTKLKTDFQDRKDVVFLKVSVDQDLEKWKAFEEEKDAANKESFVLSPTTRNSAMDNYALHAVPRYIIIGKDGNILNTNAPMPSSANIKQVLADILEN